MGLAKKRLSKERSIHFKNITIGSMLCGLGAVGSVMVYLNGIGTSTSGLGVLIHKGINELVSRGWVTPKQVQLAFSAVFLLLSIYGLVVLIRSISKMSAKNTHIGKSILTQAQAGETLKGLIDEIDEDLERESRSFGPIHVGSKWLLAEQAMRLDRIIGIYTADAGLRGVAMALVDKDRNIQYIGLDFFKGEKIQRAADDLYALCPNAHVGGIKELLDLTEPGWDSDEEPEIEIKPGQLETKGSLVLNREGFIPTSNFDREVLDEVLKSLEIGQELCIELLEPTKPSKYVETEKLIARRIDDRNWELAVGYMEFGDEPCEAVYNTDIYGALEGLANLAEEKLLPDFSMWEQRKFNKKKNKIKS